MSKHLRILLVDDYADVVESLSGLLRQQGYWVATAHDGCGAVLLSSAIQPDVVILDVEMSQLDGYKAAQRICRRTATTPALIALGGAIEEFEREQILAEGFDAYLPMPIDLAELLKLLQQIEARLAHGHPPARANERHCVKLRAGMLY